MEIAYIGLGSNLNEPLRQLQSSIKAIVKLECVQLLAVSNFYCSKPLGPQNQPDFINAIAKIKTSLSAEELLTQLLIIEQAQGRVRGEKWGPRSLDLDIIAYGQQEINLPDLTVPHPEFAKRAFVLYPLFEVAPNLTLPNGQTLRQLMLNVDRSGIELLSMEEMI